MSKNSIVMVLVVKHSWLLMASVIIVAERLVSMLYDAITFFSLFSDAV